MDILKEKVKKFYAPEPFDKNDHWDRYVVKTPAFTFQNYINTSILKNSLVHLTERSEKSDEFTSECLTYFSKNPLTQFPDTLVKVSGVNFTKSKMDAVLYLPPLFHTIFKTQDEELYGKTIVVFPIFNCEFSGDETPEEVTSLRRDFVDTIDFKRSISPKIRMKYENVDTKSKSVGKKMGLTNSGVVFNELKLLKSPESFIELENYKKEFIRVNATGPSDLVVSNKEKKTIAEGGYNEIELFVKSFLTE